VSILTEAKLLVQNTFGFIAALHHIETVKFSTVSRYNALQ